MPNFICYYLVLRILSYISYLKRCNIFYILAFVSNHTTAFTIWDNAFFYHRQQCRFATARSSRYKNHLTLVYFYINIMECLLFCQSISKTEIFILYQRHTILISAKNFCFIYILPAIHTKQAINQ